MVSNATDNSVLFSEVIKDKNQLGTFDSFVQTYVLLTVPDKYNKKSHLFVHRVLFQL
jgi:formylmethanofuran dehydrogenase subunit E-like metal-binding protein